MKTVLIVSDLYPSISKEKTVLGRADFTLIKAQSSKEAFAILKTKSVDLIIADLDLPDMSGEEFCSLIRKDNRLKSVSIVIVSKKIASDVSRSAHCGANAYITRPVNTSHLQETVCRLLDIEPRKSYRVLVKVIMRGTLSDEFFHCTSRNISVSGILLDTNKTLNKGDNLTCSFFLPGSIRVRVSGKVTRVIKRSFNMFSYGVKFDDLKPEEKTAIEMFVEKRAKSK